MDTAATLYSGQAFRWRPSMDGWHDGFVAGVPARLRVRGEHLEAVGAQEDAVRRLLRLDGSHERFLAEVARDPPLEAALARFPGLRLLRQEPWETLVSYILSQNSNVAKISRTIESLARLAAESGADGPRPRFPTPDALARVPERGLRSTGMGYRAPYVAAAARLVASGALDVDALPTMSYEEAHAALLEVPGVGAKVADCVLLYGCGHMGAFPVDVWIERVLREGYFPRKRMNHAGWGTWARRHFGPWAGYAQHYLFHARRTEGRPAPTRATSAAPRRRVARAAPA